MPRSLLAGGSRAVASGSWGLRVKKCSLIQYAKKPLSQDHIGFLDLILSLGLREDGQQPIQRWRVALKIAQ